MKTKVIIHKAEEGGYWAEVPSIPGCVTQGDTIAELILNLNEAIDGCLYVIAEDIKALFENNLQETVFENNRRKRVVFSSPTERVAAQAH